MFLVLLDYLFVCLSAHPHDYLQSKEQICMKPIPEVCLGLRNKRLNFGDDLDNDPDLNYDPNRAAEV